MDVFVAALLEHRSAGLLAAWLIGFFGLSVLELVRPRPLGRNEADSRWLGNIGLLFINAGLIELTFGEPYRTATDSPGVLPISMLTGDSLLAEILLGILATNFLRYWVHRAHHKLPLLWRLHALHHSDHRPDVTVSFPTSDTSGK